MAALFDMQTDGGDYVWRQKNGLKRCDSPSWFAALMPNTCNQSLLLCLRLHFYVHLYLPVLVGFRVYVHMYATVHTLVLLVSLYISQPQPRLLLPSLAFSILLAPNLQSFLPPLLTHLPHLSIQLTEGFTLLTVKFTHIHNYVFNQSHLKGSRMQPFFGSSRRSKSRVGGPSRLPEWALHTPDRQIFKDESSQVQEAFNLQSGALGLYARQHVDPLAAKYDCRYWIIHGCLIMCQSQMVLFYLLHTVHRFVCPPSRIVS